MTTLINYKSLEKEIILRILESLNSSMSYCKTLDIEWLSTLIENYIYQTVRRYYTKKELKKEFKEDHGEESDDIEDDEDDEEDEEDEEDEDEDEDNELNLRFVKFEYRTKYGKKDGECKRWSRNGQQLTRYYFNKDGKIEGEYRGWWSNGQLRSLYYYKNNLTYGLHQTWYKNGMPEHYYTLTEDEPRKHIGFYIICDENGRMNVMEYHKHNGETVHY